jgi:hypothetical protein
MKIHCSLLLMVTGFSLAAQEKAVPEAYERERYAESWEYNPFKTATVEEKKVVKEEEWALSGISQMDGKPSVIMINKRTREFRRVGPEEDDDGFRVVSVTSGRSVADSTAVVEEGGREITISHDPNISAVVANNRPKPNQGVPNQPGVPPAPGQRGPMPGQPGGGITPPGAPVSTGPTPEQFPPNTPNAPGAPGITPPDRNQPPPSQTTPASRRRVVIPSSQP